jgi:hypothetical protein
MQIKKQEREKTKVRGRIAWVMVPLDFSNCSSFHIIYDFLVVVGFLRPGDIFFLFFFFKADFN